jgi:hypothetical protein
MKEDLNKLTVQLNQNKSREKIEVMYFTLCRSEGHHKNECPKFAQYLGVGMPNPFPTGGPWCEICKTNGHDPYHFPIMLKYKKESKSTFCNFCKSVGNEDKNCRTLELMKERTSYAYMM